MKTEYEFKLLRERPYSIHMECSGTVGGINLSLSACAEKGDKYYQLIDNNGNILLMPERNYEKGKHELINAKDILIIKKGENNNK